MKKYVITLIITISLIVTASLFANGSSEKKSSSDTLVVAMELQYPPFEMQDENGMPVGVSPDLARALGEYLGRPIEIQNTAWTGLIPALQTGKADLVISSMTITNERKKVIDFSIPYAQSGLGLLIYKDSPVQSIDDFKHPENVLTNSSQILRLGVRSGTIASDYAKKHNLDASPNVEVIIQDTPSAQLLELVQGKVDAVIYDPLTLYKNHVDNTTTTRINLSPIEAPGPWGIAIKKGNDELLKQVNDFIVKFRAEGGFDVIAEKYLNEEKQLFEENNVEFFFDIK